MQSRREPTCPRFDSCWTRRKNRAIMANTTQASRSHETLALFHPLYFYSRNCVRYPSTIYHYQCKLSIAYLRNPKVQQKSNTNDRQTWIQDRQRRHRPRHGVFRALWSSPRRNATRTRCFYCHLL